MIHIKIKKTINQELFSKLKVGDVITWKYNDNEEYQYHTMIWNGNGSVWKSMDPLGIRTRQYQKYFDYMNNNGFDIYEVKYFRKNDVKYD